MLSLLGYEFRKMSCGLAYSFIQLQKLNSNDDNNEKTVAIAPSILTPYVSQFDLKRLESYSQNLSDFHLIMDLVPMIARLYFNILPAGVLNLSPV